MLVGERMEPLVLAGNLTAARKHYDSFSNSKEFGSFEQLVAAILDERTKRQQAEADLKNRTAACRIRVGSALARQDLPALEAIAAEGTFATAIAEEALSSIARQQCQSLFGQSDPEKEEALSRLSPHQLIAARAGSGKTTTMALKFAQLHKTFGVPVRRILALAFNRLAAIDIRKKMGDLTSPGLPINASTFHSLAYYAAVPTEKILKERELTEFIGKARRGIWNNQLEQDLLPFFRKEMKALEATHNNLSSADYYVYRRGLSQVTLNGEEVKSIGEKWIADFFFEHNIHYQYEKPVFWGRRIYRPDFSLFADGRQVILEHWGLDPNQPERSGGRSHDLLPSDYLAQIKSKRQFWQKRNWCLLLETSVSDLENGRQAFEVLLKDKLAAANIPCLRLEDTEIASRVIRRQEARLDRMLESFIQRAKKSELSPRQVEDRRKSSPPADDRTATFEKLAIRVYSEYEKMLLETKHIDFDTLLARAAKRITDSGGNCPITKNGLLAQNVDWLLIDEFQDFSLSFSSLINALRRASSKLRVVAVGDDWQAINGFAGSDLRFFRGFEQAFQRGVRDHLLTNRRSASRIVGLGNAIMQGRGQPSRAHNQAPKGNAHLAYIDDVWIELREEAAFADDRRRDALFLSRIPETTRGDRRLIAARLLKLCHSQITQNPNASFLLLARTNRINGLELEEFRRALVRCFPSPERDDIGNLDGRIRAMTVHRSKGLEADHVIVLDAVEGKYPLLHSDNALYRLFGEGLSEALEEERRLFYVACTRAKKTLMLFTERDRPAPFLEAIGSFLAHTERPQPE